MSSQIARREAFGEDAPQILRLAADRASVSGTVAQVDGVVERLRACGRLATVTDPVPNGAGGVLVTVRVLPREVALPSAKPQRRMRWTRHWVLAVAGGVAAVLALCGLATRAAYLWAVAHAAGIRTAVLVFVIVVATVVGIAVVKALSGGGTFEGTFRGRIR
jgi:hypothetical protein